MAAIWLSPFNPSRPLELPRKPITAHVLLLSVDSPQTRRWRALLLIRKFTVTTGYPDPAGCALAINRGFDVIVLDLTDSFDAGLSLCRQLRTAGVTSPVLMVYPRGGQAELLAAFEAGTNAYICGSIEDSELLGQIGALYRRRPVSAGGYASAHTPRRIPFESKIAGSIQESLARHH
jgi:DNA-binding response OmpR family regulator